MSVEFFSPSGEQVPDPSRAMLKDLILQKSEEYWNAGSGAAGLDYTRDRETSNLQLVFQKGLGFYLEYRTFDKRDSFVSLGFGDFEHTVSPNMGGDPLLLPTKFFISPELTWLAVEEFLKTGGRAATIEWANTKKTGWFYGVPD